jgi:hypothetical protein
MQLFAGQDTGARTDPRDNNLLVAPKPETPRTISP